jgi:transcriptional regulator GlxA family with amidase domain
MGRLQAIRRAYFLVLPDVHLLDLSGPAQVLCTLAELHISPTEVAYVGPIAKLRSYQGLQMEVQPLPLRLHRDDILFVVGLKLTSAGTTSNAWHQAVDWLANADFDGATVCGVCTGTFLMAQAGLLDGRWCTTHHGFLDRLAATTPAARVVANRLFIKDENIVTSAGVASGIDMALHIVAERYGMPVALRVARENVVHFRRLGGDPGLSPFLRHREHLNPAVHMAQDLLSESPAAPPSCDALAQRCGVSYRQLARLFQREAGISIKQYQLELRIDLARRLLADTSHSIEHISELAGFSSAQAFHSAWRLRETAPPLTYRRSVDSHETDWYPIDETDEAPLY